MFLGVELFWWAIFGLGILFLIGFIWYFSRGDEWTLTEEQLQDRYNEESLKDEVFDNSRFPALY